MSNKSPRLVTSEAPPTNHCEEIGDLQIVAPAQTPLRTCHTAGVMSLLSKTAAELAWLYLRVLEGLKVVEELPINLNGVLLDESEIAVSKPLPVEGR